MAKRKREGQKAQGRRNTLDRIGASRADAEITMVQWPGKEQVDIGVVAGRYASTQPIGFSIKHEDIVGALEDPQELGNWALKIGFVVLSRLIGVNPSMQPDEMVKCMIKFAHIDLEAVQKEADEMDILRGKKLAEMKQLESETLPPTDEPTDFSQIEGVKADNFVIDECKSWAPDENPQD